MVRDISPQRKSLYHVGQVIVALGLVSFLSTFISFAMHFGDFTDFESRGRSMALRAIGGMIGIIAGGVVMGIARGGAAGSGLKLDPTQAREDLEPWARLSGGLQKDALDEMGVNLPKITGALTDALGSRSGETLESRLRGLHRLHQDGILSDEEYEREKRELLDRE
jgi:hypothetical protein